MKYALMVTSSGRARTLRNLQGVIDQPMVKSWHTQFNIIYIMRSHCAQSVHPRLAGVIMVYIHQIE